MKIINHLGATGTAAYQRGLTLAAGLSMGEKYPRYAVGYTRLDGHWCGVGETDPRHRQALIKMKTTGEKRAALRRVPLPESAARVETGAVQFGDARPGYFIRGDEAMGLAHVVEHLESIFQRYPDIRFSEQLQLLSDLRCLGRVRECLLIDDDQTGRE